MTQMAYNAVFLVQKSSYGHEVLFACTDQPTAQVLSERAGGCEVEVVPMVQSIFVEVPDGDAVYPVPEAEWPAEPDEYPAEVPDEAPVSTDAEVES